MDPNEFKSMMRQLMEKMCGAAKCSPASMSHGEPSVGNEATDRTASQTPEARNAVETCGCCCPAGAPGTRAPTTRKDTP